MLKTAREIEAKVKAGKPGRWAVGDGAYIQVAQVGKRSTAAWVFRFQVDGKGRTAGLGPYPLISLTEARDKARTARKALLDGIDPIQAKRARKAQARLESAKAVTFKIAAEKYIAARKDGWKNEKHAAQWPSTLATYVFPIFGDIAVKAIDTDLVLRVLEPIWTDKPETAARVRMRIEAVLDAARVRGWREGENPARWKGHLDKLLAKRDKNGKGRHPAMPFTDVPAFMAKLRTKQSISARGLELCILTAARTGEVIGATWGEIDLRECLWTIPAARMKAGKEHRVPLAPAAVALLESLPRLNSNDHLFPGREAKPLSNMAMLELCRGMCPGFVPHGFRSSFRDWAAEKTTYQNHIVEQALAHTIESKVEAAYRRGDLLEKRRALMADWARFCESGGSNG